ncbi:MAG: COR domain-containing protein, partial [Dolichospermum sp.]
DSPIILVGNKIDEHPLYIDQYRLGNKYKNIKDIFPISCKTGAGIENLLSIIKRELANLKGINDPLPKSWFQVKTHLEKMEKDYILYHEYEGICQNEKINEKLKQSTLMELLHQLGIVLNFRDDFGLKGVPVLNPEWVTNGVYKILNDNLLLTEYRGMLTLQELKRILDDSKYPDDKPEFIIKMMERFELCFPLDDKDKYLIPDLLPKEEPATGEWENVLAFEYHYNILPSSIISRFIVRMHHQADKKTWWRSGIVLIYNKNRALVKSDQEDRKIFIFISGNSSTRKELLAIIRSQFDSIHQTIRNLEAKEKVPIPGYSGIFADYENLQVYAEKNLDFIPEGLTKTFNALKLLNGIESEAERQKRQNRERIEPSQTRGSTVTRPQPQPPISPAERGI